MININNLTFHYKADEPLFSQLSLNIESGNIYGLLGKNGAGKTTLLKLISGLRFYQHGSIEVLGYNPLCRPAPMLTDIYVIPEEFYTYPIKIKEYLNLFAPFYPNFDMDLFHNFLDEFNLPDNKKLSGFSYGMKKKFLIAFGVATQCRILILDEPTNGLDIPTKSLFRRLLASAVNENRTFIISTHQVRDMENLIDPIIILDQGKVIFNESVETVQDRLELRIHDSEPADPNVLYKDKGLGGYFGVYPKTDQNNTTNIDLETLFNTVIFNQSRISEIFGAEVSNEIQ